MILSKKRKTKALIRLRGCTGWSALLLFATLRRQVFSRRGPNAFLTDRIQQVLVEGSTSDIVKVLSRVSQRTVLGPLLALILSATSWTVYSQIPGCLLIIRIKSQEDCQILQKKPKPPNRMGEEVGHVFAPGQM